MDSFTKDIVREQDLENRPMDKQMIITII